MLKRIVSIILCAIMLLSCTIPAALASEVNISPLRALIGMYKELPDGTSIFERWGEYCVPSRSADVKMEPGEYATVAPMHWIDSRYLSYEILSVVSSDEEIVTASGYLPQIPNNDENVLIDIYGGRENLGVKLAAGKPGSADVTVTYRTYLTKAGLNYTDYRSTDTYMQTIHVTVGSPLEVKLKISSAEGYEKVHSLMIDTSNAYEQLPENLRDPFVTWLADYMNAILPDSTAATDIMKQYGTGMVSGGITSTGAAVAEVYSNAVEANKLKDWIWPAEKDTQQVAIKDTANKLLDRKQNYNIGKALIRTGERLGSALGALNNINSMLAPAVEGVRRLATIIPYYSPGNLMLDVTVTNHDDTPVIVPKMDIQLNEFLSFTSMKGPWGNSYHPEGFHVYPGETKTFSIPIYARLAPGDNNAQKSYYAGETGVYAYTANVTANCQYRYLDFATDTLNASASTSLSAYSKITRDDMQRYANSMQYNPDYFVNRFGAHNLQELLYIGCPVDVIILDNEGNELAVICSDDTAPYENTGITAAAFGERKLLQLSPEAKELYRIKVRAVDDGVMDIITLGSDVNGEIDASVYEQTPLTAGDSFDIVLPGDSGGRLHQIAADGSSTPVDAAISFNRSTLEENLAATDISSDRLEAVATAYLKGLVPINELQNSFKEAMRPDEFCGTMLNIYELYHNLQQGTSIINYLAANPGAENPSLVDVAESVGLVDEELYKKFTEDAVMQITLDDASKLLLALAEKTDSIYEPVFYFEYYDILNNSLAAEVSAEFTDEDEALSPLETLKSPELVPEDMTEDSILSREDGIALLSDIWETHSRNFTVNDRILSLFESTRSRLQTNTGSFYSEAGGNSSGMAMDSFMLHLENQPLIYLDEYGTYVCLEYASEREHLFMASPFGSTCPEDMYMTLLNEASGSFTIEEGKSVAQYALAYFPDQDGMLENRLYLIIFCTYSGYKEPGTGEGMDYLDEFMVISDQNTVAEYVRMFLPELEAKMSEPVVYEELSSDCDSPQVEALERRLSELEFFTSSPDTYYGGSTVSAVSAFQKSVGLEATGIADSETQALLFNTANSAQFLIDWLDSQG